MRPIAYFVTLFLRLIWNKKPRRYAPRAGTPGAGGPDANDSHLLSLLHAGPMSAKLLTAGLLYTTYNTPLQGSLIRALG